MHYRLMRHEDVERHLEVVARAFASLGAQRAAFDRFEWHAPGHEAAVARLRYLMVTDPGGAWVAVDDGGRLAGGAVALVRDGVWGLSSLVVDPDMQSAGVGRELLRRSLSHGAGNRRGAIIPASSDSRALRAYARAGFALHPAVKAAGPVRLDAAPDPPAGLRPCEPGDEELADELGRRVRGAGYGADLAAMAATGRVDVLPGRGLVWHDRGGCRLLCAADEAAARALLWVVLAATPADGHAQVAFVTGHQQWALPVLLDAGLELVPDGAVMVRGRLGALAPWFPSGAFL